MSLVNFFKEIQLVYPDSHDDHDKSSVVAITSFTHFNDYQVTNNLIGILKENSILESSVLYTLDNCFYEIIDNVYRHSKGITDGLTMAQCYKRKNKIKLVVVDCGRGIHSSLTEPIESKYKHLTEPQALEQCIKRGVTNGLGGMGNGLYHTSSFIKYNQGEMVLYSGNFSLNITNDKVSVEEAAFWQGTILLLNINTNVHVDYKEFMGINKDLESEYNDARGKNNIDEDKEEDSFLW